MSDLNSFKETTTEAAKLEMAVLAERMNALATVVGTGPLYAPAVTNIPALALKSTVHQLAKMPTDRPRRGRPAGSKNKAKLAKGGNGKTEAAAAPPNPADGGKAMKPDVSPKQRKARKLQGQFLGLIRQVPTEERAQYKAMIAEKGKAATVAALKTALGK